MSAVCRNLCQSWALFSSLLLSVAAGLSCPQERSCSPCVTAACWPAGVLSEAFFCPWACQNHCYNLSFFHFICNIIFWQSPCHSGLLISPTVNHISTNLIILHPHKCQFPLLSWLWLYGCFPPEPHSWLCLPPDILTCNEFSLKITCCNSSSSWTPQVAAALL